MKVYKITRQEIQEVFDRWYEEHGTAPDDFDPEATDEASSTFLDYLEEIRRTKNPV